MAGFSSNAGAGKIGGDPFGRGKDATANVILEELHGILYMVDIGGFAGGYEPETLSGLAKLAKKWGVHKLIVASNFGDLWAFFAR